MGTIWKNMGSRVWLIVTCAMLVLVLVVSLVATQSGLIYGTLKLLLGGDRYTTGAGDGDPYFTSKYATKEESVAAAYQLSEDIVAEGIVLLKNGPAADPALPLKATETKISVFGKNSVNMVYGGTGSGGRSTEKVVNLYAALQTAGFEYNTALKSFYEDNSKSGAGRPPTPSMGSNLSGYATGETPQSSYTANNIPASYTGFKDAALVVFSRIGGEGFDLPRTMKQEKDNVYDTRAAWSSTTPVPGARSINDHYLQLDQNETDLLKHVCDNFDKVIVLLNSGTSMELGFLDAPSYWTSLGMADYSSKIQAALWIGNPGGSGNTALAKILKGGVNPSGRLVDTFARNFKSDPTWNNFGNNLKFDGNKYFFNSWGSSAITQGTACFVRYEEGIYVGYRYYETRGLTDGENWYKNNVVYPFGYGKSYSEFDWEITESPANNSALTMNGKITVKVKVTNKATSLKAGKDVVQLYYTAPYKGAGKIEKAHVVLGDFAKTRLLNPGESDIVELKLRPYDMASYDWNDANDNGIKGYELDEGSYVIRVGKDAHDAWAESNTLARTYTVPAGGYKYDADPDMDNTNNKAKVENRFDDVSKHITEYGSFKSQYMSRSGWTSTWPKSPISVVENQSYNVFSRNDETIAFFAPFSLHTIKDNMDSYDADKPWFSATAPKYGQKGDLKLSDLYGLKYGDPKWDQLLDQLTVDEMGKLIGIGAFETQYIASIGKPPTKDFDGPGGFVVGSFMSISGNKTEVCFFPCESLIASAWNKKLARDMGEAVGDEGIWGGVLDNTKFTFSGWYAPAVNIHRSQFSGRNFEYYSEDGTLSGKLAAEVCAGALSNGTYTYVKHFAVNDQETDRSNNGLATWLNEQSMREIYLKPFELAVKDGGTTAMMTSFNRIGTEWAGCSYALLTEVLRNEWGFRGMVITDYNNGAGTYMDLDKMIRAGGDLNLFQSSWLSTSSSKLTSTQLTSMRNASHNILYTVVNSNAMNTIVEKKLMPYWVIIMICVDCAIVTGLGVWGFFAIRKAYKKEKAKVQ